MSKAELRRLKDRIDTIANNVLCDSMAIASRFTRPDRGGVDQ
jgi:hypothetical protein